MKNTAKLFLIPVLMFGFGYLLVPIYDVFCDWTGLNGKTGVTTVHRVSKMEVDESRLVRVEFVANLSRDVRLEFVPKQTSMMVHPGKRYQASYFARNDAGRAMTGQAVPSVSPSKAASYFDKVECFCFTQQEFAAAEGREMPVVFVVHPKLPRDVETITLGYTFFEVTGAKEKEGHGGHHKKAAVIDVGVGVGATNVGYAMAH